MPSTEKVDLNAIFADIRKGVTAFSPTARIELAFEEFTAAGERAIRAYVKVDGRVQKYSRQLHLEPHDALLELHLLCGGKLDAQE